MALDVNDPAAVNVAALLSRAGSTPPPVRDVRADTLTDAPGVYRSDRRLYLTETGALAEEGDEAAAFLLVGEGGALPQDLADELGAKPSKKAAKAAKEAAPVADPITVIANAADPAPVPEGVNTVGPAVPATGEPTTPATGDKATPPAASLGAPAA